MIQKIKKYFKNNYIEIILVALILGVGAYLRLFKISQYMTFLGDEGRDAIIVRRLLVYFDPILIGPGTSIGNMYLGPLYYYFMAPGLLLANFSPVGPAIQVAIFGVLTILMVYLIGKEWFSKKAGFIASVFYAISPTVIIFSRSSWNPNIMPFFALLTIYSVWKSWKKGEYRWLIITALSFAFVLQSHYFGGFLLPIILVFLFLMFLVSSLRSKEIDDKAPVVKFIKYSIISLFVFLILMSPLLIFDIRHNWMNLSSMKDFVVAGDDSVSFNVWESISKIPVILELISTRLLAGRSPMLGKIIVTTISIPSIILLLMRKRLHKNETFGFLFLTTWILTGLFGLSFFKYNIHDHYFGFLFPAPFLFLGGFVDGISENLSKLGKIVLAICLFYIIHVNFQNSPLKDQPNRQMQRAMTVSQKVEQESQGMPFNFAVLAKTNYEDGYAYFLEKDGYEPLHADIWDEPTISDQLFVICELPKGECDPTHSPKAEVANFGWSDIEESWEVSGVILYKLIHSKSVNQ